ncbi:hypothetical protein [Geobacter sulfurreducens]|nr:hypothetical protein [Geobacter sulfurreducens]UAC04830.1 hypothetical protein KVP06_03850 [Geobacter sulfurreducens]HML79292.1 hypothetical protein [Geobacter sulfurreducens]
MPDNETRWWMLQIQYQERHPGQLNLLSQPLPRDEVLRQSLELIPSSIRSISGDRTWGLADLIKVRPDVLAADLTVRPPLGRIAEEPRPGVLEDAKEPRFFTPVVVHIPLQIIVVHRASDVSRFARSAKAFATVFYDLLDEALRKLEMDQHYVLEVEPIAKIGSFVEWFNSLDHLNRIIVHYVGPNLPARPGSLVQSIRDTANSFRKSLRSETVDLIANEPKLEETDVQELDQAVADRRLRMRARGTRSGIGTNWSSRHKPEAETAIVPLTEEQLTNPKTTSEKITGYLEDYFGQRYQ